MAKFIAALCNEMIELRMWIVPSTSAQRGWVGPFENLAQHKITKFSCLLGKFVILGSLLQKKKSLDKHSVG